MRYGKNSTVTLSSLLIELHILVCRGDLHQLLWLQASGLIHCVINSPVLTVKFPHKPFAVVWKPAPQNLCLNCLASTFWLVLIKSSSSHLVPLSTCGATDYLWCHCLLVVPLSTCGATWVHIFWYSASWLLEDLGTCVSHNDLRALCFFCFGLPMMKQELFCCMVCLAISERGVTRGWRWGWCSDIGSVGGGWRNCWGWTGHFGEWFETGFVRNGWFV